MDNPSRREWGAARVGDQECAGTDGREHAGQLAGMVSAASQTVGRGRSEGHRAQSECAEAEALTVEEIETARARAKAVADLRIENQRRQDAARHSWPENRVSHSYSV